MLAPQLFLPRIFDTHCHYNLKGLDANWSEHWQNAQQHGVVGAVVVGTEVDSSARAIKIASTDSKLGAAIGIHPTEYTQIALSYSANQSADEWTAEEMLAQVHTEMEKLKRIFDQRTVAAIGETGLDYFRIGSDTPEQQQLIKKIQAAGLRAHLKLADGQLPILLHVRDQGEAAYWDVLRILEEENYTGKLILHCVSGPLPYIKRALEMGGYVSVAGNVTYKNAESLREIVQQVPADRLLIETDAPFLPPARYRGQICEPWMIAETAEFLTNQMQIDLEQCLANSYQLFPKLQIDSLQP